MLCHVAKVSCSSNTFPWHRASSDQSSVSAPTLAHVRTSLMLHHGKFSLVLNTVTAEKCTWTQREEGFIHRLSRTKQSSLGHSLCHKVQIQGLKTTALWSTWSAPEKNNLKHTTAKAQVSVDHNFSPMKKSLWAYIWEGPSLTEPGFSALYSQVS